MSGARSARVALGGTAATLLGATATLLRAAPVAALCPGCIEGSTESVASGFAWSIAFMMAVPYALLGVIGGGLFLAYRRSVRSELEAFLEEERECRRGGDGIG